MQRLFNIACEFVCSVSVQTGMSESVIVFVYYYFFFNI